MFVCACLYMHQKRLCVHVILCTYSCNCPKGRELCIESYVFLCLCDAIIQNFNSMFNFELHFMSAVSKLKYFLHFIFHSSSYKYESSYLNIWYLSCVFIFLKYIIPKIFAGIVLSLSFKNVYLKENIFNFFLFTKNDLSWRFEHQILLNFSNRSVPIVRSFFSTLHVFFKIKNKIKEWKTYK